MTLIERFKNVCQSFFVEPQPVPQVETPRRGWSRGEEISFQHSWLFRGNPAPYNPDSLVGRRGLKIYSEMGHDPQIRACLALRESAVLSPGFEIVAAELPDDASAGRRGDAEMHAEFVRFCINELTGEYESRLGEILSALQWGFSISEMIFDQITYGPFQGLIGLKDLKTRHPEGFDFEQDAYGNLRSIRQTNEPIYHLWKFLICSHRMRYANYYGESELRSAYSPWWCKSNALKFATISLERHATPIPVFTAEPAHQYTDAQTASMLAFINDLQVKTGIVVPPGIKLDFQHPEPRTESVFVPFLKYLDDQIRISLLCPGLLGMSGEQLTGSLARSSTEFEVFLWTVARERGILESLHNERLIKTVCDFNFQIEDGKYPRFQFRQMTEELKRQTYDAWLRGITGKGLTPTLKDENKARGLIGFEPIEESECEAGNAQAVPPQLFSKRYAAARADFPAMHEYFENEHKPFLARMRESMAKFSDEVIEWFKGRENLSLDDVGTFSLETPAEMLTELEELEKHGLRRGWAIAAKELPKEIRERAETKTPMLSDALNVPYVYGRQGSTVRPLRKRYQNDIGLVPTEAIKALLARASLIKASIDDDLRNEIKFALAGHLEFGRSMEETIRRLREILLPWVGNDPESLTQSYRLERIIRTESAYAFSAARGGMVDASDGFITGIEYTSILDERTSSPPCRELDSLRVPVTSEFYRRVQPPNHPNCRSTTIFITRDDEQNFSTESEISAAITLIDPKFK